MKELINILNKSLDKIVDLSNEDYKVIFEDTDNRIHISFISKDNHIYRIHTIITDNKSVVLGTFKLNSNEFLNEFSDQVVINEIIPFLKMNYLRGVISKLPESIKQTNKLDISIDLKWLKETFHEISQEEGNSEMIENIKMSSNKDKVNIVFDVDCGRYGLHRNNSVEINDRGYVQVYLSGPLEGSGVEYELSNKIRNKINNN